MLRKIHGTNFFHITFLDRTNIKCQNGPVLPSTQVFYFNSQAITYLMCYVYDITTKTNKLDSITKQLRVIQISTLSLPGYTYILKSQY
jgi:hypothetical protein